MKKTFVATTLALAATATFAQAGAPIKIGVVTPLSGTYAGIGQQVKWGLDLAAAQINAGGGVMGRKLELIFEDEEANPAVATRWPSGEKATQGTPPAWPTRRCTTARLPCSRM